MKKFKLDRIISIATLVASVIAIFLVLKKPAPVSVPQAPAAVAANAQSFEQKLEQLEQASQQSQANAGYSQASQSESSQSGSGTAVSGAPGPKAEVRINSDEIGAVLAQSLGKVLSHQGVRVEGLQSPFLPVDGQQPGLFQPQQGDIALRFAQFLFRLNSHRR